MLLNNRANLCLLLTAVFLAGVPTVSMAFSQGIGFQAPGIPPSLSDRKLTVSGCGALSTATGPSGGSVFICLFTTSNPKQTFDLSYSTKTGGSIPGVPPSKLIITVGDFADNPSCNGHENGSYITNNNTLACSKYYGIYAQISNPQAPWGASQWAVNPQDGNGFILQIGGAPAI